MNRPGGPGIAHARAEVSGFCPVTMDQDVMFNTDKTVEKRLTVVRGGGKKATPSRPCSVRAGSPAAEDLTLVRRENTTELVSARCFVGRESNPTSCFPVWNWTRSLLGSGANSWRGIYLNQVIERLPCGQRFGSEVGCL